MFRCLARDGHLDPTAPGLDRLAASFAAVPDSHLFVVDAAQRIDQIGWPVARDLAIAVAATDCARIDHPLADEVRHHAAAVLAGRPLDEPVLRRLQARLDMLALAGMGLPIPEILAVAGLAGAPDDGMPGFLVAHAAWAGRYPESASLLARLAGAVVGVHDGWTAYDAHRHLNSTAAERSAEVVVHAARITGADLVPDLVALALRLFDAPERD